MSAIERAAFEPAPADDRLPAALPRPDHRNGGLGMWLFIATEAMLFVMFYVAYFMLAKGGPRWLAEEPPKLPLALGMLVVLLTSSGVLHWGERRSQAGREGAARAAAWVTAALGVAFLVLQSIEYRNHLRTLKPSSDAYGSLFYTITSVHGLHVLVGLLMLAYVAVMPRVEPTGGRWGASLHNVGLYWHFVDVVWVTIVALLYVLPNLR